MATADGGNGLLVEMSWRKDFINGNFDPQQQRLTYIEQLEGEAWQPLSTAGNNKLSIKLINLLYAA